MDSVDYKIKKKATKSMPMPNGPRRTSKTMDGSPSNNSIFENTMKVNKKSNRETVDYLWDRGNNVIERLEALIKEKRRGTLGYGVANERDLDTADRMREAVQRDIERYCEEHGITEARENIWAADPEGQKNTTGEGGVKYELRSDADAEVQKAISDISYDKKAGIIMCLLTQIKWQLFLEKST